MLELQGNSCKDCKVFTDNIEESALEIIYKLLSNPLFEKAKIRIMPDVHTGKGITIGFSCPISDFVNPSHVGVDIGCGVESIFFEKAIPEDKYAIFEHRVKKSIPLGMNQHSKTMFELKDFFKFLNSEIQKAYQTSKGAINFTQFKKEKDLEDWCSSRGVEYKTFLHSIGTLGSGNHFMEYDENTELGKYAFTVHCGSRNVGLKICKHWEHIGKGICFDKDKCNDEIKDFIKSFKGNSCDIPMHVEAIKKKYRVEGSEGYLRGDNLKGYLTDMVICQAYANFNRKIIFDIVNGVVQKLFQKDGGNKIVNHIASVHNYIDFNDMIIRKGAIRSYKGEEMIIPFNMKDGIAICEGKSNNDWNCTAPHGSGRLMSRSKAKKDIDLEHFKEEMKGIYTTSVCRNTLDEAPDAYKPTDEIIKNIEPTCDVKFFMIPKINIKDSSASEER